MSPYLVVLIAVVVTLVIALPIASIVVAEQKRLEAMSCDQLRKYYGFQEGYKHFLYISRNCQPPGADHP